MARVKEAIEGAKRIDPGAKEMALAVFDFAQNAADAWQRSSSAVRREILESVSSTPS